MKSTVNILATGNLGLNTSTNGMAMKFFFLALALLALAAGSVSAQGLVTLINIGASISTNSVVDDAATGLTSGSGGQYYFALYCSTNATSVNGQTTAILGSANNNYAFNYSSAWTLVAYGTNIATAGRFLSTSRNASGYTTVAGVPAGSNAQFVVIGWSANIGTNIAAVQAWYNGGYSYSDGWIGQSAVGGSLLLGGDANGFTYPSPTVLGSVSPRIPGFTLGRAALGLFQPPSVTAQATNQTVAIGGTTSFTVTADGDLTLSLSGQWRLNGTNINTGGNYIVSNTNYPDAFYPVRRGIFTLIVTNAQLTNTGNYSVLIVNTAGSVVSSNAVLTVQAGAGTPPVIVSQPSDATVGAGGNVTLSVIATGTNPLMYQWSLNNTNLAGATNASLALTAAQLTNAGNYSVSITNAYGATNSASAVLTVQTFPPFITSQPANLTVQAGNSATFTVAATGTATVSYQWALNGTNLPGATGASLTIANAQVGNGGTYFVTVANAYGSTNSANASLTVTRVLNYGYVILTSLANSATKMFTNSAIGGAPTGLTASNGIIFRYALFASTNATSVNGGTNAILGATNTNYAFNDAAWTLAAYGTNTLLPGRMRSAQANGSGFTPIPIVGSAGVFGRFVLVGWSAGMGTNIAAVQAWFNNGNPATDGWIGQSPVSGLMLMGDGGSLPPAALFGAGAQQLHGLTLGLASPNPAANYPPPAVPPPMLSSKAVGGLLKLSWPLSYASYGLQSCSQLGGTWDDVASTPVSDGTNWTVSVLLVTEQPYYRLIIQ